MSGLLHGATERNIVEQQPRSARAVAPHSAHIVTANELRSKTFAPVKYVVPGIVPEGVTLLVAKPKEGKSWLALDLCIACTTERFTLGTIKPLQGDVLYLALEDSERRLQRRMDKLLPTFGSAWPKRLSFATEWKRMDDGGLSALEAWCNSVADPILIVIDTLAKVRPPQKGKQTLYESDHDAIAGLQRLANARGVAIVVIHHLRKMDAEDPFDTVSGTLGLTGAADAIILMKRNPAGIVLHARGRDIEESETAAQFDKATCRWTLLGAAAEVRRSNERGRVIAALREAGAALSPKEIQSAAELRNRNATDLLLRKMTKDGEIVRAERGRYRLPPPDAGQIGQKERLSDQASDKPQENSNLSNLSDLSNVDDPTASTAHNGAATLSPTSDPYLEIPAFLKRH